MPTTFPRKMRSHVHEWGKEYDCFYDGTGSPPLILPTVFPSGIRTEVALTHNEIHAAPGRGEIQRIVCTQESGSAGSFTLDIVDKKFGTGVSPDIQNIIYKETPIVAFTNKIFDIAYELKDLDQRDRTLYCGVTPFGGTGVYKIDVYTNSAGE